MGRIAALAYVKLSKLGLGMAIELQSRKVILNYCNYPCSRVPVPTNPLLTFLCYFICILLNKVLKSEQHPFCFSLLTLG